MESAPLRRAPYLLAARSTRSSFAVRASVHRSLISLAVLLNDVVLPTEAAHPALQNGKGLLMTLEHTNRADNSAGWDTKYRIKQTNVTMKGKQGKTGPCWKEMEPFLFECSMKELMRQSIFLTWRDRAKAPDGPILAKAELPLKIFLIAVRGQIRQQTAVEAILKDGKGVEIAKMTATIEFHRLPHYAQLLGGLHLDGGIDGGAPLLPGLPAPLIEMNHPDLYIAHPKGAAPVSKYEKSGPIKVPPISGPSPDAPEFVESGSLSPRKEQPAAAAAPESPVSPRSKDAKTAKKKEKEEREREERERKEKEKQEKERKEKEKAAERERLEREVKEREKAEKEAKMQKKEESKLARAKTSNNLQSPPASATPTPEKEAKLNRALSGSALIPAKSTKPVDAPPPPPVEAPVVVAVPPPPEQDNLRASTSTPAGAKWSRLQEMPVHLVSPRTGIYGAPTPTYDNNGAPLDRGWELVLQALEAAFPPGYTFDLTKSVTAPRSIADDQRGRAPTDPALAILQRELADMNQPPPEKVPHHKAAAAAPASRQAPTPALALPASSATRPAPSQPSPPATQVSSSPSASPSGSRHKSHRSPHSARHHHQSEYKPSPSLPKATPTSAAAPATVPAVPAPMYSLPPTTAPREEPLPLGWEVKTDAHGRKFYIDHVTKTTSWTPPKSTSSLPPGWEKRRDPQGRTYFVDHVNKTTQWSPPTGTSGM